MEYFESIGYGVVDIAYHHILSPQDCNKLRRSDTPASISFRTMPDFIVSNTEDSFYAELKVGASASKVYLEALPLMVNQQREAILHIPCVYIYAGQVTNGSMVAAYSTDIHPEKLVIPKRNSRIKNIITKTFTCPVEERETRSGTSGDAFVVIPAEDVRGWLSLENFMQQKTPA